MHCLLFVLTLFYFAKAKLNCPVGYDYKENICILANVRMKEKGDAQNWCIRQNLHLPIIADKVANDVIATLVMQNRAWLGLTCLTENADECQWDGSSEYRFFVKNSYRNFIGGAPNVTIGPCVTIARTGMWYSSPCTHVENLAICQYSESEYPPQKICLPSKRVEEKAFARKPVPDTTLVNLENSCYFGSFVRNYADGEKFCKDNCGEVGFASNDGGNSFMRDFPSPTTEIDFLYVKPGNWSPPAVYQIGNPNEKYFVIKDKRWGSCISMALKDEIVKRGQWVTSPCSSKTLSYVICQKNPENECDRTSLPLTETKCTEPYFLNDTGTFYSPGYPGPSLTNECEYFITQNSGIASVSFKELVLDKNSYISFYDGVFALNPFKTLTMDNLPRYLNFQATGNMLRMVVSIQNKSDGDGEQVNYFSFTYSNGSTTSKDHTSDL